MLSFENFVKLMSPSLSELKVTPSFCFAFKIPDDHAVTNVYTMCVCNRGDTILRHGGLHTDLNQCNQGS